jgi:S-adenosylmethionine:tRNA ribosyltransferase-isomerase
MRLSDFDFDLPEGLIATRPARPRSSARMLVAEGDAIRDAHVFDLPGLLRPGDRLVLNDTRVIPARLTGAAAGRGGDRGADRGDAARTARLGGVARASEAAAQGARRRGDRLLRPPVRRRGGREEGTARLAFNLTGEDFDAALAEAGQMPLPPYIAQKRAADAQDKDDYQTVWARRAGAVAAPTASLHFDEPLLAALAARGVAFTHVTLHVGAGTFLPVKVDDVRDHRMHAEWGEITPEAAAEIATRPARPAGGSSRWAPRPCAFESAARADGVVRPWIGETDIFITPGFDFRVCDALMTNFHLPKSTLMMLVSAFMGVEPIRAIYAHAVAQGYRFFSYGDASLLIPEGGKRP